MALFLDVDIMRIRNHWLLRIGYSVVSKLLKFNKFEASIDKWVSELFDYRITTSLERYRSSHGHYI